jgi:AcrR family transcriptional regulator
MVATKRTKTQIKLLSSARELFYKYGFKRVTVEEICQEASVSKMSFYRSFENKFAIAKEVFRTEIRGRMQEYQTIFDSDDPFVDKMEAIIHLKLQHADQIGIEFIQDLIAYDDKDFQRFMAEMQRENNQMIMAFFRKAQENGDIRKDLRLELIPILAQSLSNMASNEPLAAMFPSTRELIKEMTTFFFYGIVSHPRHP